MYCGTICVTVFLCKFWLKRVLLRYTRTEQVTLDMRSDIRVVCVVRFLYATRMCVHRVCQPQKYHIHENSMFSTSYTRRERRCYSFWTPSIINIKTGPWKFLPRVWGLQLRVYMQACITYTQSFPFTNDASTNLESLTDPINRNIRLKTSKLCTYIPMPLGQLHYNCPARRRSQQECFP
jgi:hypothetical protein